MDSEGRIIAQVYTADEAIPVSGVMVVVTRRTPTGPVELVGVRTTDAMGKTAPMTLAAPAPGLSQEPSGRVSWASCDVTAVHPGYQRIIVENVQIFPGVVTIQEFALIPLEEYPEQWGQTEVFDVTPQEL